MKDIKNYDQLIMWNFDRREMGSAIQKGVPTCISIIAIMNYILVSIDPRLNIHKITHKRRYLTSHQSTVTPNYIGIVGLNLIILEYNYKIITFLNDYKIILSLCGKGESRKLYNLNSLNRITFIGGVEIVNIIITVMPGLNREKITHKRRHIALHYGRITPYYIFVSRFYFIKLQNS